MTEDRSHARLQQTSTSPMLKDWRLHDGKRTPLSIAAQQGDIESVLMLLEQGVDPDEQDGDGCTPIFRAVMHNRTEVGKLLLKTGKVDPNRLFGGYSLLGMLAARGNRSLVCALLENGDVNPDQKDGEGATALWRAIKMGRWTMAMRLLDTRRVDANYLHQGQRPLTMATISRAKKMVQRLLSLARTDPDGKDSEGATPLWLAVKQKHVDIASLLLDRGRIDVNHFHEGCTPLLEAVGQQDEAMVELLLANPNVDVNFPDLSGDTALHIATRGGTVWRPYPSIPILKSLLRREDIQWNMPNMFGVTPFDVAARLFNTKWSDSSVIAAFLEKDAAVARSDQGPLCRFCFLLYHELRESFMRKRCKPLRFLKQSVEKSECELCRLLYLYALRAHSNEDVWSWLELAGSEFPHFELRVVTSSYGSHGEKFTRRWLTKDTERDMPLWWSREPLTPKDSVNTIQRWVDECSGSSEHHLCSSTAQNFPKRLLELDFANTEKLVKLIECCEGQSGRYVAFSHCWGASGAVPKTEAKNYKKHLAGLSFEALPRSFRDVADMCWSLGIRHLWIDSLCIIQDDEKDWQHQSTEMTAIYQNAFITIAATASSSSEEGLRIRRQLADHIPTPDPQETLAVRPRADPRVLRQSPLYERGWTLQETVISRRVVHFASDQLYWVCQSKSMSEDGMHNADVRPLPRISGEIPSEAWDIWWSWVEDYSRRRLSFFSDKLPAIAGLTRKFEELSHATPAVGLWMEDIHYSLLWWPTRPVSRLPFIPSWSWASVDGPVKPMYESRCLRELKPLATIGPQSLTVQWTGEELTSRISHATLRVTGRLRKANFRPGYSRIYHTGAGHSCHNEPGYQPHAQLTNDTSYHPRVSCVMFDAGFAKKKTPLDKIWCLEILEEPGAFQGFLILEPTSEAQREYRRIGVGYVSSAPSIIDDDFFSCAAMEEVVLV